MRTLMAAMGLGGAAVVLQGCGGGSTPGGGGHHSDTCLNDHLNLVSQSSVGSITGTAKANLPIPGFPDQNVQMTLTTDQKIDFDKFNLRMDITDGTISATVSGVKIDYAVNVQLIVNAGKKELVASYGLHPKDPNAPKSLPSIKNCTKMTDDKIPDPAKISAAFKTIIMPLLQTVSKCGGNDGTDDTWNLDYDSAHPDPSMPIPPLPTGDSLKVSSVMKMNKDYLISEVKESITFSGKDPSSGSNVTVDGSVVIDATSTGQVAGGPSDSDLDYSGWGTCYPAAPPGSTINSVFQPQDKTEVTAVLDKVILEGALRKIFLASLHSEPKSEDKHVVV